MWAIASAGVLLTSSIGSPTAYPASDRSLAASSAFASSRKKGGVARLNAEVVAVEQVDGVRAFGGGKAAEAADAVPPTTPATRQMLASRNCNEAAKPFGVMPRA
nr:hypothetical protein [uncultured Sphingomonas sp.]